jgi:hypothetical protein
MLILLLEQIRVAMAACCQQLLGIAAGIKLKQNYLYNRGIGLRVVVTIHANQRVLLISRLGNHPHSLRKRKLLEV